MLISLLLKLVNSCFEQVGLSILSMTAPVSQSGSLWDGEFMQNSRLTCPHHCVGRPVETSCPSLLTFPIHPLWRGVFTEEDQGE